MNDTLLSLIELQQIDSKILEKKSKIDALPKKIKEKERVYIEAKSILDKKQERLQLVEKKKREKEIENDEINDKIRKLKAKTSEIKSNKEYQSLLKEIESAHKSITIIENDILEFMQEIEDIKKLLLKDEQKILDEKTNLENLTKTIQNEINELDDEIKTLKNTRTQFIKKIGEDVYKRYMNLLKNSRGLAVVETVNEICKGCNLHIPPQLYVEIKSNSTNIYTCPQCYRILYYKAENKTEIKTEGQ